jgi:hypothetical protein
MRPKVVRWWALQASGGQLQFFGRRAKVRRPRGWLLPTPKPQDQLSAATADRDVLERFARGTALDA